MDTAISGCSFLPIHTEQMATSTTYVAVRKPALPDAATPAG